MSVTAFLFFIAFKMLSSFLQIDFLKSLTLPNGLIETIFGKLFKKVLYDLFKNNQILRPIDENRQPR